MSMIETLLDEHQQILSFLDRFEQDLCLFIEENIFDIHHYRAHIDFIKEFADKKHHQKEEKVLFKYMEEYLGLPAQKLIRYGMLVEHDLARYYVQEIEKHISIFNQHPTTKTKLSIIGLSYAYIDLLRRHIDKENKVVYPFALRQLSSDLFEKMEQEEQNY